jgi:tryptophanase
MNVTPPTHNAFIVRPHISTTPEEREAILRAVEYNVFAFPAALLTCDFLSDSGTSAMTDVQWAAMLRGDESYGRNSGYYCLLDAFRDIFERSDDRKYLFRDVLAGTADAACYRNLLLEEHGGGFINGSRLQLMRPNFFLVPQGRCAESLLFSTLGDVLRSRELIGTANDTTDGDQDHSRHSDSDRPVIISNGFFDTTAANASVAGFELRTFTQPGLVNPFPAELIGKTNPFKGNLDANATSAFLAIEGNAKRVVLILLTITNNWAAGQPVSMVNIEAAAELATKHNIPLFFDACRFAENAKFIQDFEIGYQDRTIPQIVQEMFRHADGFTISLKKDGLANMGGALCYRDQGRFVATFGQEVAIRLKERQIMCFGNDSYGGMSGRDIMAAAVGLYEVTKETYLAERIGQVRRFVESLVTEGVPVLLPPGGHAAFLDMDRFFEGCGRSYADFASVGFTLELLREYGIRALEAGPFGWEWDKKGAAIQAEGSIPNLVRFSVPRYLMMDRHIQYTVAAVVQLHNRRHTIPNARITRGKELRMRVFQCGLEPVPVQELAQSFHVVDDTGLVRTFFDMARRDLRSLHQLLELGERAWGILQEGLEVAMRSWGHRAIPDRPNGWLSDAGIGHSPIEYSVAIQLNTAAVEIRFLVEAQAEENSMAAFQQSALNLTHDLKNQYAQSVSLDRFDTVSDLFFPTEQEAHGPFAAWHSLSVGDGANLQPTWKLYLTPRATGIANAGSLIRDALERLKMTQAYNLLKSLLSEFDTFAYFSLDLYPGPTSRVKVYVQHRGVDLNGLVKKLAISVSEGVQLTEIRCFCTTLSGGSEGPYKRKPILTCFAFTPEEGGGEPSRPEIAVYFPVSEYAGNDAEIRRRIEEYISKAVPFDRQDAVLEKYRACVKAVAHRRLEDRCGIHSWVGLKQTKRQGSVVTFYFSPEVFSVK